MALTGEFKELSFADIMQTYCITNQTVCVTTEYDTGENGVFFIDRGQIVDAQLDNLCGETAFYRALALSEGKFRIDLNVITGLQTIDVDWKTLLLEGMRLLDEQKQAASIPQTVNTNSDNAVFPVVSNQSAVTTYSSILQAGSINSKTEYGFEIVGIDYTDDDTSAPEKKPAEIGQDVFDDPLDAQDLLDLDSYSNVTEIAGFELPAAEVENAPELAESVEINPEIFEIGSEPEDFISNAVTSFDADFAIESEDDFDECDEVESAAYFVEEVKTNFEEAKDGETNFEEDETDFEFESEQITAEFDFEEDLTVLNEVVDDSVPTYLSEAEETEITTNLESSSETPIIDYLETENSAPALIVSDDSDLTTNEIPADMKSALVEDTEDDKLEVAEIIPAEIIPAEIIAAETSANIETDCAEPLEIVEEIEFVEATQTVEATEDIAAEPLIANAEVEPLIANAAVEPLIADAVEELSSEPSEIDFAPSEPSEIVFAPSEPAEIVFTPSEPEPALLPGNNDAVVTTNETLLEHDLLLRELCATGIMQNGVVIDEDGSVICEVGESGATVAKLAFLIHGLETVALPGFGLGEFQGAVLEINDKSLMIARSHDLTCAFFRPHRVPKVRAFDEIHRAFERVFNLTK